MGEDITTVLRKEERFLTKVWKKGKVGKVAVSLFYLVGLTPLIAEVLALYSIRGMIFLLPQAVTERIAVLAFLVGSMFFLSGWFAVFLRAIMEDMVKK